MPGAPAPSSFGRHHRHREPDQRHHACGEQAANREKVARLEREAGSASKRAKVHVPPALEQLVLGCLAKEPENRPYSAAALAESLATSDANSWMQPDVKEWWSMRQR